ncbi:CYTH domain-containing protein [Microbacterium sp. 4R-513]|uniref:CYTH domain-containing protein n=1 Tax=Microbacterium sp. 4R-513 TaxID=2567934 RepID=UPI0013E1BE09|nr:CYTH domain-containing protein [Microbacterium sp. 4R-513]QIG40921.1 CYTH domain-containing protein [Microbacterium sp. 4R-513]
MAGSSETPKDGPSSSLEVELKFDVDDATPLPDWTGLPGITSVSDPEPRDLDARYFDTDDLALAHAGYALRRRSGGPDAGWHIKGPREEGGGRTEQHWPLTGDETLPAAVHEAVRSAVPQATDASLSPLARIRNARTAYHLRDAEGGVVAEFVDDHVVATDERRGGGAEQAWREWELELGPAAPTDPDEIAAFFAAAERVMTAAGARPAASDSKLARTLGH